MRRSELPELHYIVPVENLPSTLDRGILCHRDADGLDHVSVADPRMQERRSRVQVPGGLPLHDYANLYINARNAMLFTVLRNSAHGSIAVLKIQPDVLDIDDVVITSQNAASDFPLYFRAPEGLEQIDRDYVFAESWKHPEDQIEEWRHKSAMCAEVLVPDVVEPEYIEGIYVCCEAVAERVRPIARDLPLIVNKRLFFNARC